MRREDSVYPRDWLRIAEKDLKRVKNLMEANDPEAAGFYLEQTVEKFLKAYLLSNGWKLKKIHDLEILINDSLKFASELERFRNVCQTISGFYFLDRYPLTLEAGIELDDVQETLKEIFPLFDFVRQRMK
jgi:HEPN domain-containing protein